MSVRVCEDCRWFRPAKHGWFRRWVDPDSDKRYARCAQSTYVVNAEVNMVYRGATPVDREMHHCTTERSSLRDDGCGPTARKFESRGVGYLGHVST